MSQPTPTPPSPPSPAHIVLAVLGALLGAGLKMYSSPILGLILIVISLLGLWGVLLPTLRQYLPFSQRMILSSGWGIIIAGGFVLWWYSTPPNSAQREALDQQSTPSISQGGNNNSIINKNDSDNATNNFNGPTTVNQFITVTSTPTPIIELRETLTKNKKVATGYESTVKLAVVSPHPVGNLYIAAHGKDVREVSLIPMRTGLSMSGPSGIREGYAFTNLQNAYGDLQIAVITASEVGPTNTLQIEGRIE